jgi:hypothetical protein
MRAPILGQEQGSCQSFALERHASSTDSIARHGIFGMFAGLTFQKNAG